MYNFSQLLQEQKATIKENPITRGYSVILWNDKFEESLKDFNITYSLNDKNFVLSKNQFDNNIYNVLLDATISKESIPNGIILLEDK